MPCIIVLVGQLVLCAQSSTKGYIRARNKRQSISCLFYTKITKPQKSSESTRLAESHNANVRQNLETSKTNFRGDSRSDVTVVKKKNIKKALKTRICWYYGVCWIYRYLILEEKEKTLFKKKEQTNNKKIKKGI